MSMGAHASFMRNLKLQVRMQLATVSVLAGSFTVLAIAILMQQNIERVLTQWGDDVKINIYLKESATQGDQSRISKFIKETNLFGKIKFLTKKDAAEKFKERVGKYTPGLLSDLEFDNPLPSSFEMVMAGGLKTNQQFSQMLGVIADIKKIPGVDEVSYGQGWVENYTSVLKTFSIISAIFIFVLLAGSLFVIGNSIGNTILQRRDEIEILELFGATRAMIAWPFIYEGLILGFISAAAAVLLTYGLYILQSEAMISQLSFWNIKAKIEFLSLSRIIYILAFGAALGGVGSLIWVRRFSTGWAAAEANSR